MTVFGNNNCSAAEAQDRALRVLIDECVTRRLIVKLPKSANFDIVHSVDVQELGWGASDSEILRFLQRAEYDLFVTADNALIKDCVRHGIRSAKYDMGKIYLESGEVLTVGKYRPSGTGDGVLKQRRKSLKYRIKGVYFGLRRRYREYRAEKMRRASKCKICGVQCRSPARLQGHLKMSRCGRASSSGSSRIRLEQTFSHLAKNCHICHKIATIIQFLSKPYK